jgi:hypothetical protein
MVGQKKPPVYFRPSKKSFVSKETGWTYVKKTVRVSYNSGTPCSVSPPRKSKDSTPGERGMDRGKGVGGEERRSGGVDGRRSRALSVRTAAVRFLSKMPRRSKSLTAPRGRGCWLDKRRGRRIWWGKSLAGDGGRCWRWSRLGQRESSRRGSSA